MTHVKPSKEELQANIDKVANELESTPPAEPAKPVVPVTPPVEPVVETPPTPPVTPTPPVESTPPVEPVAPVEPPIEEVDYKKKFAESTREAQVQGFKNKELSKAIVEANSLPEPTDEELRHEYSDWEDMTSTEQRLAKDNLYNKRKFDNIAQAQSKFTKVDEWMDKVTIFTENPVTLNEHPELEGKIEDFKAFASKPSRVGLDFSDLVLAFNGELAKNKPAPKKGQMFEQGSGGDKTPITPKDNRLSIEQGRILMQTNYPEFKRQLKAGNIKNE